MSRTATIATVGALGIGGVLLWRSRAGSSQDITKLVTDALDALDQATDRIGAVAATPRSAVSGGNDGVTTAPLPAAALIEAINAPLDEGQIRPVANLATGRLYQPVLTDSNEVIFAGAAGDDWVMRDGEWVRL